MIKRPKNKLCKRLTLIIDKMLHTSIYPNAFKVVKVLAILKKLQTYITAAYTLKNI